MFRTRRSRKQFHRFGQSLAPDTSVAGKEVGTLRRFVPASFPPLRALEGWTNRIPHGFDEKSLLWQYPERLGRFVPAQYPKLSALDGNVIRRLVSYDPVKLYQPPGRLRRFVPGQFPRIDAIYGWTLRGTAKPPEWVYVQLDYQDQYRVADDSLNRYELFIGEDASPDLEAAPDDTSASLPFSYVITPPLVGSTDFHIVVRKRNQYDLTSLNQYERIVTVAAGGAEVVANPSSPASVTLESAPDGYLSLTATYYFRQDGDNRGDYWQIYVTDTGSDPVPGVDTPTVVLMQHDDVNLSWIKYPIGPYLGGEDVRVIVRVLRSSDSATDGNTTVTQYDVPTFPNPPTGSVFGGSQYRNK